MLLLQNVCETFEHSSESRNRMHEHSLDEYMNKWNKQIDCMLCWMIMLFGSTVHHSSILTEVAAGTSILGLGVFSPIFGILSYRKN